MMMTHSFSLDLMTPGAPTRIQVKQGDTMTHSLEISLFAQGEPWPIPGEATPLVRWFALDPESGKSARGIFDTLPNGSNAWNCAENQLDLVLVPQMFALPGIVQADVLFVAGEKTLATANFEFYVNPVPTEGSEPESQSYYKVATLEQINGVIGDFQTRLDAMEQLLANLGHTVLELERIVRPE